MTGHGHALISQEKRYEMPYERIIDKDRRNASVRLYGGIGTDVDGNLLAHDIAEMDGMVDTVTLHINSPGGNVFDGLSIVSALLSAKAYISVVVDGIAASMAAVIAVCGDEVSMQDFGKLMIHDPYYLDSGKENLSKKELKALGSITDTLQRILSRRGCDRDKIAKLMREETWFSAEEALEAGLIDRIIVSERKKEFRGISPTDILDKVKNEYKPINKSKKSMKEIAKLLGLPEDATEEQITGKINELKNGIALREKALVDRYLEMGTKAGTVTDKNKEKLERLASADFDLFLDLVTATATSGTAEENKEENLTGKPAGEETGRLSDAISRLKSKGGSPQKTGKSWDYYQKNDPGYLDRLERENPEEFKRLLDEYENSL